MPKKVKTLKTTVKTRSITKWLKDDYEALLRGPEDDPHAQVARWLRKQRDDAILEARLKAHNDKVKESLVHRVGAHGPETRFSDWYVTK